MDSEWAKHLVTIAITLISALVTVRVLIAEMKKDIEFLKSQIMQLHDQRREDLKSLRGVVDNLIAERKQDMHEVKMDLKEMGKAITDVRILLRDQK